MLYLQGQTIELQMVCGDTLVQFFCQKFRKVISMSTRFLGLACLVALVAGLAVKAEEAKKFSAKCVVAGDPDAKQDKFSEYKGGKVYFCCDGCKGKFDKEPAKYAVKANAQLVSTEQAKQVKCPLAGKPCNPDQTVEVSGIKVAFCCAGCKGKVAAAEGEEQAKLVFSDEAFNKGFEVKTAKKPKKDKE